MQKETRKSISDNNLELEKELNFFNKTSIKSERDDFINIYGVSVVTLLMCVGLSIILNKLSTFTTTSSYQSHAYINSYNQEKDIIIDSQIETIKARAKLVSNSFEIEKNITNKETIELLSTFLEGKNLNNVSVFEINSRIIRNTSGEEKALALSLMSKFNKIKAYKTSLMQNNPNDNVKLELLDKILSEMDLVISQSSMMHSSFHRNNH